jgi:hypothetical protein
MKLRAARTAMFARELGGGAAKRTTGFAFRKVAADFAAAATSCWCM